MYLYIFENGEAKVYNKINDGDLQACDNGILQIFDISENQVKGYLDGEWFIVIIEEND